MRSSGRDEGSDDVKLHRNYVFVILTFVCPCIASIIVNDDQQDATISCLWFRVS